MVKITWDNVEDRTYESGLDRGVLYLPDGSGVPWNGLTSVVETYTKESSPVYYEGMKINELVTFGDFEAKMTAVTYPDEFTDIEGFASPKKGVFYGEQPSKFFCLCYRTSIGNSLEGDVGYKLHIIYNILAIPSDKTYATVSDDPSLVEFEWSLVAVPEEVPGFSPTAHIVLDSREIDPWLIDDLETMLYGSSSSDAALIPMSELVSYISEWYRVKITDNGDGTWTATTQRDGFISFGLYDYFSITGVNAIYLDDVTFEISDTVDVSDVPQLKIVDNGDGTWIAQTDHESIIVFIDEDIFEIRNASATYLNATTYQISDTTTED